ncbi:RNA polymerase sigma factor [Luteimonas sp. BDR2-5]|uniref:RNA polymerase sigma factor n=1 Tax=Proluteimonas luteida TaxID=2878685 RepID=UPI001E28E559|nr:RNA polymerase sigma factor [Luteimonas sp. BDR2-5]MCD9026773.1 RNA polymerase sigma factor [Luteimonas sp. BDR2-5]
MDAENVALLFAADEPVHGGRSRTRDRQTEPSMNTLDSDREHVPASASEGKPRSVFDTVVVDCHNELSEYFRKRIGHRDTAADLTQETFSRMMQYRDAPGIGDYRLLMYRIANNLVYEHHRRGKRRRTSHHVSLSDIDVLPARQPSLEAITEARQTIERLVTHTLQALPPHYRHAFRLSRIDGLTGREVAERMGISPKTVEKYIKRTLDACRAAVGDRDA